MKMFEGIQTFLDEGGDAACYALCILKIAERITGFKIDVIETLCVCIEKGFIYYNWKNPNDGNNFFVNEAAKMLSFLVGKSYTISKEAPNYVAKNNEQIVDRWERTKVGSVIGHFRLPDWDSLRDSQTVRFGKIASKRVFRPV